MIGTSRKDGKGLFYQLLEPGSGTMLAQVRAGAERGAAVIFANEC